MTDEPRQQEKKPSRPHSGVWPAMALVLAFACVMGAAGAVDQALRHTNFDLLLSAIRNGFVVWMLVSYGLVASAAALVVWASGRNQRHDPNDLVAKPGKESAEQPGGADPAKGGPVQP